MLNFFLFILATIGMTNIIVDSNLFQPVRNWLKKVLPEKMYELVECHQCCGTWCGFFCGAFLISWHPMHIFFCGCAGSFLASTNYLLTELVLSKTDFEVDVEMPNGTELFERETEA